MDWGPEVVKGKSLKMALYENPSENGAYWLDPNTLSVCFPLCIPCPLWLNKKAGHALLFKNFLNITFSSFFNSHTRFNKLKLFLPNALYVQQLLHRFKWMLFSVLHTMASAVSGPTLGRVCSSSTVAVFVLLFFSANTDPAEDTSAKHTMTIN